MGFLVAPVKKPWHHGFGGEKFLPRDLKFLRKAILKSFFLNRKVMFHFEDVGVGVCVCIFTHLNKTSILKKQITNHQ